MKSGKMKVTEKEAFLVLYVSNWLGGKGFLVQSQSVLKKKIKPPKKTQTKRQSPIAFNAELKVSRIAISAVTSVSTLYCMCEKSWPVVW